LVADPMEFLFIIIPPDVDQRSAHMTGRAEPKDPVHAYMWFLIAGEQITQAKNHVNQSITMEQLLEAEQRAAEWIRKMRKIPPSSIDNPPNASTA
jgi:hypothetical protein